MATLLELAATRLAGRFCGTARCLLRVEHPARPKGGTAFRVMEFTLSSHRPADRPPLPALLSIPRWA